MFAFSLSQMLFVFLGEGFITVFPFFSRFSSFFLSALHTLFCAQRKRPTLPGNTFFLLPADKVLISVGRGRGSRRESYLSLALTFRFQAIRNVNKFTIKLKVVVLHRS